MNSGIGPEGSRPAPQRFMSSGRNRIILSLLFVTVLIATVSFTVNDLFFAHAQSTDSPLVTPAQIDQLNQDVRNHISITPKVHANAVNASVLPAYNNVGTSSDGASTNASFDNGGTSYSAQALAWSGIKPNQAFVYDGITFTWPGAAAGAANNYVAAGQVLPVTPVVNATTLGFVGSANNGPSSGTATITYTDNSTLHFTLGMSDWTLGAGKVQPSFGNKIVTATLYRDTNTGSKQNVKTYLFYTYVGLDPAKTIQSVTLPTQATSGRIHIFTIGTRSNYSNLYNNAGMSDDANPAGANFDNGGASYSFQSFIGNPNNSSQYLAPGSTVGMEGVNFSWPDTLAGAPNNYLAMGQTVRVTPVAHGLRVGFIGAATSGPSCGTASVNYVGGNTQSFSLCLSDWTLNALHNPASYGNIPFNVTPYRNIPSGKQNVPAFVFYTEVRVDPTQTVESVTLPSSTTSGSLHIFAIGVSAGEDFNNVGARQDNGSNVFVSLDGQHSGYSLDAMNKAGLSKPDTNNWMHLTVNQVKFSVAYSNSVFYDNLAAQGQTLGVAPVKNETRLAFLGAATNRAQVGTATIIYTDGSTSTFQLGFNDWTGPSPLLYHNSIALTMPYRDTLRGAQNIKTYLYYTQVPLTAGKTVAAVTLPTNANIHIFGFSAA